MTKTKDSVYSRYRKQTHIGLFLGVIVVGVAVRRRVGRVALAAGVIRGAVRVAVVVGAVRVRDSCWCRAAEQRASCTRSLGSCVRSASWSSGLSLVAKSAKRKAE